MKNIVNDSPIQVNPFRVIFSPNGLKPYIFGVSNLEKALFCAETLIRFDLGSWPGQAPRTNPMGPYHEHDQMIADFENYRRLHNLNKDNTLFYFCTIEQKDSDDIWWIVSDGDCREKRYALGQALAKQ